MDGTLLDSAEDISDSVNFTLHQLGLPARSDGEVKGFIGEGVNVLLESALGTKDKEEVAKAVGIFRSHYLEHCTDKSSLYPGVHEILKDLKSVPIGLISNKPQAMVEKILEHFKISKSFEVVLGAEAAREKKPHPEPVLKSLALMGVPAKGAMIVGDGIADIQAGKSAGVLTCAVTYGYKEKKELEAQKPDFMIDRLIDLKKITRIIPGAKVSFARRASQKSDDRALSEEVPLP